jgi:hypothetical protein
VTTSPGLLLAARRELLPGELADRLEHAQPRIALRCRLPVDQVLVQQRSQAVQHVRDALGVVATDRQDLVQPDTVDEGGQSAE